MHELVHTSLPNGLIAGTHGFATVAMTRNLPDGLRTRLEQLSAYNHRTSAHDDSYLRENPVNWQHLVLPQGEHVVSRVAPAPFDYTGRTNRIARHLCFAKDELLVNGAATVAQLAGAKLSEEWTGEARWLEADTSFASMLSRDVPSGIASSAPHWDSLLGKNVGTETARRVAQFVKDNLTSPRKSINFRADAATDADGTRLLGLFADIISLLPPALRRDVTFATYGAALPTGMRCILRGVYDDSPSFKVVSATQPWVDCIHGKMMNAAKLPELKIEAKPTVVAAVLPSEKKTGVQATPKKNVAVECSGERSHQKKSLVPAIVICVFIGLALLATGFYVLHKMSVQQSGLDRVEAQKQEQDRAERLAAEAKKVEEEKRQKEEEMRKQKEAEAARIRSEEEKKRKAEEEKRRIEEEKRKAKAISEQKVGTVDPTMEYAMRKTSAPKIDRMENAFTNFTGQVVFRAPNMEKAEDRVAFSVATTNAWVYWLSNQKIVRKKIEVSEKMNPALRQKIVSVQPSSKENFWGDSPCVLWYDVDGRKLYWQWNEIKGVAFTEQQQTIDVWSVLTKGNQLISATLKKTGFIFEYSLQREMGDKSLSVKGLTEKRLTLEQFHSHILTAQNTSRKDEEEMEAKIEEKKKEIRGQEVLIKEKENDEAKIKKIDARLEEIKHELKKERAKDKQTEEALKKERTEKKNEKDKLVNKNKISLEKLKEMLQKKNEDLNQLEERLRNIREEKLNSKDLVGCRFTLKVANGK